MSVAHPRARALALFDFDGTLTSRDTFSAFVLFATSRRRVLRGVLRLSPLIARFRLGQVPAKDLRRAMIAEAFRGRSEVEVRELGERFAREYLPGAFRPNALERVAWHEARGDEIVLVSASLGMYLDPLCRRMGWARISSDLEARNGVLSGHYLGADCTGKEKASRVQERYRLESFADVYAYGDTREDDELLALANHRYFRWRRV